MRKFVPFIIIALAGCVGSSEEPNGSGGSGDGSGGNASGGSRGSGGSDGSGGAASGSGGQTGSGGHDGSGGSSGSGGSGSGGNSSGSGGNGTGGSGSGGSGTGGNGSGGNGSGGAASGGSVGSGGSVASGGAVGSGGSGSGGKGGGSGTTGSGGTVAAVCTSNKTWTSGNGDTMRPGDDCTSCHSFTIAGTIYPTLHEPSNCYGTAANGLKVVITGSDGSTMTLTPNSTSGNFYTSTTIKTPYSAKVTDNAGGSRAMTATQTKGNCNSCHTQNGANSAPGRIMAP